MEERTELETKQQKKFKMKPAAFIYFSSFSPPSPPKSASEIVFVGRLVLQWNGLWT